MRCSRSSIGLWNLRLVVVTVILAGCHTPQHSNVLIFGTNTKLGIDISYDPKTQEPNLVVGYKRQEGVWMPLLANLGSNGLEPCAISPPEIATNIFYRGNEGNNLDTYSVLASFGAKFAAKGSSTAGPEASGGLAQFFATGLAARKLAQVGGAQLVSVQPSDAEAAAYAALTDTDLLHDQGVLDGLLKKKLKAGTTLDGKTFSPDETQDYADALAAKKKMTLMTIRRKGGRDLKDINENLANATE